MVAESRDALSELQRQEAELLLGHKTTGALQKTLAKPFKPSSAVSIRLTMSGPPDPADPLKVEVGGLRAAGANGAFGLPSLERALPNTRNNYSIILK